LKIFSGYFGGNLAPSYDELIKELFCYENVPLTTSVVDFDLYSEIQKKKT